MSDSASIATVLVVHMDYHYRGLNDYSITAHSFRLLAASDDGTVLDREFVSEVGSDSEDSLDINGSILAFIQDNFDGVIPALVSLDMPDLVRYFRQEAPEVVRRLELSPRIDLRAHINMVPLMSLLHGNMPRKDDVARDLNALELYLFFREIYQYAADHPPLAIWERDLLIDNNGRSGSRIKFAAAVSIY